MDVGIRDHIDVKDNVACIKSSLLCVRWSSTCSLDVKELLPLRGNSIKPRVAQNPLLSEHAHYIRGQRRRSCRDQLHYVVP